MLTTRSVLILACLLLFLCPALASAQQPLTLGVPVDGTLSGTGDQEYYEVSVAAGQHLFVVVDATIYNSNSYDLYIKYNALPTPTDYDDKGDSPDADQAVEIPVTQGGTYYILLRSASGGGNYTIVAHTAATFPTLAAGTPQPGALQSTYDIKYYQVPVSAGEHLIVLLDASVYNSNSYDLYIRFGVLPTTLIYDDASDLPDADQAVEIPVTQAGTYYVMIRSTSGGDDYTITAHTAATFPTLTDGTPRPGELQSSYDCKLYQVTVAAGEHLIVFLDASVYNSNSYDLYVKLGSLPTTLIYDDAGDLPDADQAVEIASTQAGTYYILIRSASGGDNYTITAHTAATFPTLTDGTPQPGELQSSYDCKLYQVTVAAGEHLIVFLDASVYNSNSYDLYVKLGSLPTTLIYDDAGDLPDADQAGEIPVTQAGTYYILIRSTSGGDNYTITAHTAATFLTLTDGTPRPGELQSSYDCKLYQVTVAAGEHLIVFLDASVYNSNSYDLYIRVGSLPTTLIYDDASDLPDADQAVEIPVTQAGTYYVMIRSTSGGDDYTITAHTAATFPTLTDGTPRPGELQSSYDCKLYQVTVAAGEHLIVFLDASVYNSNSYDLYIRFGSLPTTLIHDDAGDLPDADQAVEIPVTQGGTYYILIRSASGGDDYTITAHTAATFPTLIPGVSRPGEMQSTYDVKLYQVTVAAGEDLVVLLDGASNYNRYDLYLRFGALPTTLIYDAKGAGAHADQRIEVNPTQAGTYYLMIRSTSGGGAYTLRASIVRCRIFLPVVVN